jgi:hypothetical protein
LRTAGRGHRRSNPLTNLERHRESKASLQQSFVTLNKRIAAAAKNEQKGLRLLGLA